MNEYADPQQVVAECMGVWRPPPKLSLSEWADEHFYLSAESSAEAGRWKTLPYQRGLLDAITDPTVTQVSVMKSARVGFTKCMNAAIGYYMHRDPCSILVVQPTVDDAKGYSKEEIAPMLRDSPELARIVFEDAEENGPRDSGNTILHKALALDTPIPTPTGWTTVAEIDPGNWVFDERGRPTRVSEVTPVFRGRPCFRVRFSDGAEIVSDAEHGWEVEWWRAVKAKGRAKTTIERGILTTEQIAVRVRTGNRYRYAIRNAGPLDLPAADLPLDPYVLGAWLGDGLSHRAWVVAGHEDAEAMRENLESCGHVVAARDAGRTALLQLDPSPAQRGPDGRMQLATSGAIHALRQIGVLGKVGASKKHIPPRYLRASPTQRIALLQGLMDTDGHARKRDGLCVLVTSSPTLADGYRDLLSGLGIKWVCKEITPAQGNTAFRFEFSAPFPLFRLPRKLADQKPFALRCGRRRIVAVEPVPSVPVKCITVESESHLFLAGVQMIPTHNSFPGGVLSMVGANSGAGFRRISRRVVMFDEVDAYPPSAGSDGDPIKLGIKRTEYFWNRKIIAGSTPLIAGASRITELFEQGDQRRYFVPCPQCGHMAPLVFTLKDGETAGGQGNSGHVMRWPEGKPQDAFFECERNGCVIEHRDKRAMVAQGEWRASAEFRGHASFHIWAAYSFSPNATWAHLAEEFLEARGTQEKLKTFINTALGETWTERGEAPDWERLYQRRERYQIGSVPEGVVIITAGVDVQKDRLVYLVQGWGIDKQNWTIDAGVLMGDTSNAETWKQLDELLNRTFPRGDGTEMAIARLAVDSGYNTNEVYTWARGAGPRVMAVKGQDSSAKVLLGTPTAVDLNRKGKRKARGYRVWPVGTHIAKSELYGWLRQPAPVDGDPYPPGFVHFPELDGEFFKQLTGEQLVSRKNKKGFTVREWEIIPGRENHYLDAWVYARAAATAEGLDKASRSAAPPPAPVVRPAAVPDAPPPPPRSDRRRPRVQGGWLSRRR